ncbi:MAG: hypothetical protein EA423_10190 [Phycisphaerales bacterium]|nr:MAG: hypothetical protein EA423_10190 [Phycisphaerales bacterium]
MKIALACEYVRDLPWSHSRWAPAIAIALAERGHTIGVYADGVETPADFDHERITLCVRNPRWTIKKRCPLRYQRWASRRLSGAERSLSLTALVPADLWLPLGPGSRGQFRALVGDRSLIVRAFESLQHRWLLSAIVAERRALRVSAARGVDPVALSLAPCRQTENGTPNETDWRELLRIEAGRPLLALSVADGVHNRLRAVAAAVARARREPVLALLGTEWWSAAGAVESLPRERVRFVGMLTDPRSLLRACDGVLIVGPAGPGSTGRMLMEGLEAGAPVVASADAAGQRPGVFTVADPESQAAWLGAIDMATGAETKDPAQPPRTLDDFIDDIERRLQGSGRTKR